MIVSVFVYLRILTGDWPFDYVSKLRHRFENVKKLNFDFILYIFMLCSGMHATLVAVHWNKYSESW